jgi:hypothetical protein
MIRLGFSSTMMMQPTASEDLVHLLAGKLKTAKQLHFCSGAQLVLKTSNCNLHVTESSFSLIANIT